MLMGYLWISPRWRLHRIRWDYIGLYSTYAHVATIPHLLTSGQINPMSVNSWNQIMDYWYHLETLSHLNFYEFARCVSLENKNQVKNTILDKDEKHLNTLTWHSLHEDHPLAATHHLLEHTNKSWGECKTRLISRVVGSFIPQQKTGI